MMSKPGAHQHLALNTSIERTHNSGIKLLVFQLTIQSSYAENVEHDAEGDCFDTVQWLFSEDETWRIKTFAIDQDMHTHHIDGPVAEQVAMENTMKHYEDVVAKAFVIEFDDPHDKKEVEGVMEDHGLSKRISVPVARAASCSNCRLTFQSRER